MCHPQKAASPHPLESPPLSNHSFVHRASLQIRGRARDSSHEAQAAPTLASPLLAQRQAPARARPAPSLAKPRAKLAAASPTATDAFHKTTFRIDSLRARINSKASNSNATNATYRSRCADSAPRRSELIDAVGTQEFLLAGRGRWRRANPGRIDDRADFGPYTQAKCNFAGWTNNLQRPTDFIICSG